MKSLKLPLLSLCVLVWSCQKNDLHENDPNPQLSGSLSLFSSEMLTPEEAERLILFQEEYTRSAEEVLSMADGLLDRMKGEARLALVRSSQQRPTIKQKIEVAGIVSTLDVVSSADPASIYLIEYGAGQGFCMLTDDKRVREPIIMYADEGNADLPLDQPGFQYVLDIFKSYVTEEIARTEAMRGDSVHQVLLAKYEVQVGDDMLSRQYTVKSKATGQQDKVSDVQIKSLTDVIISPMAEPTRPFTGPYWTVPKMSARWGQGAPFNKYAPNNYAGCNAVAVGQILHHKYKDYIYNYAGTIPNVTPVISEKYAWKSFRDNWYDWPSGGAESESVAKFMQDLNNSSNLAATYFYDGNGTGAPIENCARTFRNMGVLADNCQNYDAELIYRNNGNISVVGGKVAGSAYGHTWVVDSMSNATGTKFAHCNWGYDGTGNGMCNANLFYRAGMYYTQNLKMIRNIQFTRRR